MNDIERLTELLGYSPCKDEDCYLCVRETAPNACVLYIKEKLAAHLIANGVTVQKHGRCDMCSIGATDTGSIGLYGNGWQVCIRKQGWTYDLVINHCGEQIAIPIDYCPNCGADMRGVKDDQK